MSTIAMTRTESDEVSREPIEEKQMSHLQFNSEHGVVEERVGGEGTEEAIAAAEVMTETLEKIEAPAEKEVEGAVTNVLHTKTTIIEVHGWTGMGGPSCTKQAEYCWTMAGSSLKMKGTKGTISSV